MNIRYRIDLDEAERAQLAKMLSGGKHVARRIKRAPILLAADTGISDEEITRTVSVSSSTVYRIKRRFVLNGLESALSEEPRPGAARKLSAKETALLIATACSSPSQGRSAGHWNYWPTHGAPDRTRCLLARDGAMTPLRRYSQTIATRHVVHPTDRRPPSFSEESDNALPLLG